MRYSIVASFAAVLLASCSLMPVQTISRTELLTPTAYTAVDPTSYTDMMYYGADDTYDYFTRNSLRYRVLRTEKSMPESARFTFNNWQGGKMYRDCLVGAVRDSVRDKLLPAGTTSGAGNSAVSSSQLEQTGRAIQTWLQQRKTR